MAFRERTAMNENAKKQTKNKISFFVKICICAVFVLLLVIVVQMNVRINEKKDTLLAIEAEVSEQLLSIEKIQSDIDKLPDSIEDLDEETLKKIAKEELNLQENDVVIFSSSQPN